MRRATQNTHQHPISPTQPYIPDETNFFPKWMHGVSGADNSDNETRMRAISDAGKFGFGVSSAQAGGKQLWEIPEYISNLGTKITAYQSLMDAADAKARNASLSLEERQGWVQEYIADSTAYWAAKTEMVNLEAQAAAEGKAKQERLTQDIMGTILTHIGEVSTNAGGQSVIVLSAGQPDAKALTRQLRDTIAGANPELAAALDQLMAAVGGPYWN
jgi:hypothetical protein